MNWKQKNEPQVVDMTKNIINFAAQIEGRLLITRKKEKEKQPINHYFPLQEA